MLFKVDPIKAKHQDTQADAELCDMRCNIPQIEDFIYFIFSQHILYMFSPYNMETQPSMCEYECVCVCVCLCVCVCVHACVCISV